MTYSFNEYPGEMEEDTFRSTIKITNLSTCGTVRDAFLQHGLAPDDKIDRREQVLMFRRVEKEMEGTLKELMREGHFDEAKEMGRRLEDLREEFGGLQVSLLSYFIAKRTINSHTEHYLHKQIRSTSTPVRFYPRVTTHSNIQTTVST